MINVYYVKKDFIMQQLALQLAQHVVILIVKLVIFHQELSVIVVFKILVLQMESVHNVLVVQYLHKALAYLAQLQAIAIDAKI